MHSLEILLNENIIFYHNENIDNNSKKNEKTLVNKNFQEIRKGI